MDPLKPLLPEAWRAEPYFSKLDALVGVPVINVHMCALLSWLVISTVMVGWLCHVSLAVCCPPFYKKFISRWPRYYPPSMLQWRLFHGWRVCSGVVMEVLKEPGLRLVAACVSDL